LFDGEVLTALNDLAAGEGAGTLVKLIISKAPDGAERDALISIVSEGNENLLYLLTNIDTALETRLEELLNFDMSDLTIDEIKEQFISRANPKMA